MTSEIALESSLRSWEFVEYAATAVVFVGAIGEFLAEFTDIFNLKHDPLKKHLLGKLSTIILVIGLAGELLGVVQTSQLSGRIIASLQEKTALALQGAAKLQAAIGDRDLSADQRRNIGDSLRQFSGRTVWMRSYPNDPEAARLIILLKASLEPSIHIEDRTGDLLTSSSLVLGIRIEHAQNERDFAEALVKVFREDGKLSVEPLPPFGGGYTTEILVGVRPITLTK